MSPRNMSEREIVESMRYKPSSTSAQGLSWLQRITLNPGVRRHVEIARYTLEHPPSPLPPEPSARSRLAENIARVQGLEAQLEGLEILRQNLPAYLAKNEDIGEEQLKRKPEVKQCRRKTLMELHYLQKIAIPKLRHAVRVQETYPGMTPQEIEDHHEEENQWALLMPAKQRIMESSVEEKMAPTDIPESVFNTLFNLAQDRFCESTEDDPTWFVDKILREYCQD